MANSVRQMGIANSVRQMGMANSVSQTESIKFIYQKCKNKGCNPHVLPNSEYALF
jgi:hypothetical protein